MVLLGPYCNTAPSIMGTQKGTIILITTLMVPEPQFHSRSATFTTALSQNQMPVTVLMIEISETPGNYGIAFLCIYIYIYIYMHNDKFEKSTSTTNYTYMYIYI